LTGLYLQDDFHYSGRNKHSYLRLTCYYEVDREGRTGQLKVFAKRDMRMFDQCNIRAFVEPMDGSSELTETTPVTYKKADSGMALSYAFSNPMLLRVECH